MKNTIPEYKIFITPEKDETTSYFEGNAKASILIGIFDEKSEALMLFLEKILASVKLNLHKDCRIVYFSSLKSSENFDNDDSPHLNYPSFIHISQDPQVRQAIFFGIQPKDLGLNIETPQYFITEIGNCYLLFADKLTIIEKSPDLKKALWGCLKGLFDV